MSPRPYKLGQRQASADQTRARILSAARELLMASQGFSGFSIEAVARQADVARMTVYHQFGSKVGLLEALFDSLASYGGMDQLASAFRQPDPLKALDDYITVFSRFWDSDRLVTRRMRSLAALDPDFEQVVRARDERRRHGLRVLVGRIAEQHGRPAAGTLDSESSNAGSLSSESSNAGSLSCSESSNAGSLSCEAIDILYTLIGFEFFDTLAGPTRSIQEVAPLIQRLARAALAMNEG